MTISTLPGRVRARFAFSALAAVALVISHDAIFFAQLGPGEALSRTLRQAAHDYWGAAGTGLTAAGIAAAVAVSLRLSRLRRQAQELGTGPVPLPRRPYLARTATTWLTLFGVVALGFLLQENVEHLRAHGHLIGPGALIGPEYPLALPVIGLITLAGASLGAAFAGAEQALVSAIAAVRRVQLRPPASLARAALRLGPPHIAPLAMAAPGRAPPAAGFAIS